MMSLMMQSLASILMLFRVVSRRHLFLHSFLNESKSKRKGRLFCVFTLILTLMLISPFGQDRPPPPNINHLPVSV